MLQPIEFLNKVYLQQPESVESLADIYLCLAAKEILSMFDTKFCDSNRLGNVTEMMRKCNEYFSLADETVKLYALSFILKGFYYLVLGELAMFGTASIVPLNVVKIPFRRYWPRGGIFCLCSQAHCQCSRQFQAKVPVLELYWIGKPICCQR